MLSLHLVLGPKITWCLPHHVPSYPRRETVSKACRIMLQTFFLNYWCLILLHRIVQVLNELVQELSQFGLLLSFDLVNHTEYLRLYNLQVVFLPEGLNQCVNVDIIVIFFFIRVLYEETFIWAAVMESRNRLGVPQTWVLPSIRCRLLEGVRVGIADPTDL